MSETKIVPYWKVPSGPRGLQSVIVLSEVAIGTLIGAIITNGLLILFSPTLFEKWGNLVLWIGIVSVVCLLAGLFVFFLLVADYGVWDDTYTLNGESILIIGITALIIIIVLAAYLSPLTDKTGIPTGLHEQTIQIDDKTEMYYNEYTLYLIRSGDDVYYTEWALWSQVEIGGCYKVTVDFDRYVYRDRYYSITSIQGVECLP